jgi:hypothetical protein
MRFGKLSLAAIAAASLISAPVMAEEAKIRQAYTENIVVVQAPAAHSHAIAIAAAVAAMVVLSDDAIAQPEQRIDVDDHMVISFDRDGYLPYGVFLAVLRTGPVGITSLQTTSLVDLPAKSRFDNFADRLRATTIT